MFCVLCQKFGKKLKTLLTDRIQIDWCEFEELTEQFIMMLGQVFNNITHNDVYLFLTL